MGKLKSFVRIFNILLKVRDFEGFSETDQKEIWRLLSE